MKLHIFSPENDGPTWYLLPDRKEEIRIVHYFCWMWKDRDKMVVDETRAIASYFWRFVFEGKPFTIQMLAELKDLGIKYRHRLSAEQDNEIQSEGDVPMQQFGVSSYTSRRRISHLDKFLKSKWMKGIGLSCDEIKTQLIEITGSKVPLRKLSEEHKSQFETQLIESSFVSEISDAIDSLSERIDGKDETINLLSNQVEAMRHEIKRLNSAVNDKDEYYQNVVKHQTNMQIVLMNIVSRMPDEWVKKHLSGHPELEEFIPHNKKEVA